jgi:signal recognition particle GTPase
VLAEKPELDADGFAILGMGDIATLLERAKEKLDRSKAEAFAKKALSRGSHFGRHHGRHHLGT